MFNTSYTVAVYLYEKIARNKKMRNGYRLTTIPQESSAPPMEMKKDAPKTMEPIYSSERIPDDEGIP